MAFDSRQSVDSDDGARTGRTARSDAGRASGNWNTPGVWIAVAFLAVIAFVGFLGGPLFRLDPNAIDMGSRFLDPSLAHPFGTDDLGRDYFARVAEGGRISLIVALLAAATSVVIGLLVGLAAGLSGGLLDALLMRFVDFLSAIPWLVLVIVASALLRPGLLTIIAVIGGFSWTGLARLVRAETLSVREREFIQYAQFIGTPPLRLALRHVMPEILPTVIVATTSGISGMILTESTLSFLGMGIQAPMASWGSLLSLAQDKLQQSPHLAVIPGLLITATVVSFNVLGEHLRRAVSIGDPS